MLKKILFLALVAAFPIAVASCGNDDNGDNGITDDNGSTGDNLLQSQSPLVITQPSNLEVATTHQLVTTGGSGSGAITFTRTDGTDAIATVSTSGLVEAVSIGYITVTATRAGDTTYNPITSAAITITVVDLPLDAPVILNISDLRHVTSNELPNGIAGNPGESFTPNLGQGFHMATSDGLVLSFENLASPDTARARIRGIIGGNDLGFLDFPTGIDVSTDVNLTELGIYFIPITGFNTTGRGFNRRGITEVNFQRMHYVTSITGFRTNEINSIEISNLNNLRSISNAFVNNPLEEITLKNLPQLNQLGNDAFTTPDGMPNLTLENLTLINLPLLLEEEREEFGTMWPTIHNNAFGTSGLTPSEVRGAIIMPSTDDVAEEVNMKVVSRKEVLGIFA